MEINSVAISTESQPTFAIQSENALRDSSWQVFKRIISSEMVKLTVASVGTLLSFTAVAISMPSLIVVAGTTTAALLASAYLVVQIAFVLFLVIRMSLNSGEVYKKVRYEVSLLPTILCNALNANKWPWSHAILDNSLTLGAIPLKNKGHVAEIIERGVTKVLTLLEPFELSTKSIFSEPATAEDWLCNDIEHTFIETADFEPISFENIAASVAEIRNAIESNGHVYVHCKAGRGRSAMVVISYLLKFGVAHGLSFEDVDQAIAYVKERRPVININEVQKAAICSYFTRMCQA